MTAIKAYILRLILCGFFVSLSNALLRGKRAGRVLTLCGGCLLILTAVRPLLRVDLTRLPDLVTGLTRSERMAQAREKNRDILIALVEQQTVSWLSTQAQTLGMEASFTVTTREAEADTFVPDAVSVTGAWTQAQRETLTNRIERELGIPPEKQRWVGD